MNPIRVLIRRLRALFRKEQLDAEMSEEIRQHLELQEEENLARGMAPEEARHAAQRGFGGVEQVKERVREQRTWMSLEQGFQDVRYGLRSWKKSPGFAVAGVLTLACGIGAATAAFTAMSVLLFTPLPVRSPNELALLKRSTAAGPTANAAEFFSFPLYEALRTGMGLVDGVAAMSYGNLTVVVAPGAAAELAQSGQVTGNFFPLLGVPVILGRGLNPEDDKPDDPQPVVVLSHRYWARQFGGDPGVIGKALTLDRVAFTVVGVTAPEFVGIDLGLVPDLWVPLQVLRRLQPSDAAFRDENAPWLRVIGRVSGTTLRQATAEADVIYQRQVREIATRVGARWEKSPQRRALDGHLTWDSGRSGYNQAMPFLKPMLISLLIIIVLVLFLCGANVASLLLARTRARQQEFAVRLSLGCGRGRLIRQVITETLLLAAAGAAGGVLLARWGLHVLVYRFFPPDLVQLTGLRIDPDWRALAAAIACAVVTGMVVGLVPALRASRIDLITALKAQGNNGSEKGRHWLGRFLVGAQIAVAVCLLAVAGLFLRTVQNLRRVDLGYEQENLLRVPLLSDRKLTGAERIALARELVRQVATLPAARFVSIGDGLFGGGGTMRFEIEGYNPGPEEVVAAQAAFVGPDFFATAGMSLVRGRVPTANELLPMNDDPGAIGAVVITESMARKFFGESDPLDRVVKLSQPNASYRIAGVVRDVRFRGARQKASDVIFLPASRQFAWVPNMMLYIRTRGDAAAAVADVRTLLRRVAPQVPLRGPIMTQEFAVEASMLQERVIAQVAGFFSILGLLLAAVGLYGVLAFDVSRRTREIGIRMALGADRRAVQWLVLRQGLGLPLAGALAGLVAAIGLTRLISRLLYNVSPGDPLTLAATIGILLLVALAACWVPTRRATKVDPMIALRAE